jgi:TRAP-type transport system periplasmic protein
VIRDRNFNQVQKFLTGTGHFFEFIIVVSNKKRFDGLKAENRGALEEAMRKAVRKQREDASKADLEALEELKKRGMQFEQASPRLVAEMRNATAGVLDLLKKKVDPKLVDEVLASSR